VPEPASPGGPPAVAPSLDDPLVDAATEGIGGVLGRFARRGRSLTNVTRVLVLGTFGFVALGVVQRAPCIDNGWTKTTASHQFVEPYTHLCYSDAANVFQADGFMAKLTPYISNKHLPFPVLTGAAQQIAGVLAQHLGTGLISQTQWFYAVTVWFLLIFAGITTLALIGLAGRRPWDAAMFAFGPMLLLAGTINWDLIAVGLTTAAILAWSRRRPGVAGLLLGFAEGVKYYPAMLLIALLVLCWRAGRMRSWLLAFVSTAFGWALVNVPVILTAPHGWSYWFATTRDQVAGNGSLWTAIGEIANLQLSNVNLAATILLAVLWLGVVLVALLSAARPRFAQIAFLVVASFVLVDKVYSPQDALWLMPLAVLARPRWRDYLIWQSCEVIYYVCVWLYLLGLIVPTRGLSASLYTVAILIHLGGLVYLGVRVVRDVLDPMGDPVRVTAGDDPSGGVLDGADDHYGFGPMSVRLSRSRRRKTAEEPAKHEPAKHEPAKHEPAKHEPAKHESAKHESTKNSAPEESNDDAKPGEPVSNGSTSSGEMSADTTSDDAKSEGESATEDANLDATPSPSAK
jgi:hypothetical protein